MFKRNVGKLDRIVRLTLGIVLFPAGLFWLGGLQGSVLGVLAISLGLIGLISGITGFCALYVLLGISTLEKENEQTARSASVASCCQHDP